MLQQPELQSQIENTSRWEYGMLRSDNEEQSDSEQNESSLKGGRDYRAVAAPDPVMFFVKQFTQSHSGKKHVFFSSFQTKLLQPGATYDIWF